MFSGFLRAVALARSEGITAAEVTARPVPWLKAAAGALRPGGTRGRAWGPSRNGPGNRCCCQKF
ncbi:hypothetical protein [Streptomyces sp. NPDC001889]